MDALSYVAGAAQVKGNFTVLANGDVSFTITTPSRDAAEKIQEAVGIGNIRTNSRNGESMSYKFALQRRADVDALARILMPVLVGEAREDAEKVRDHLDQWFEDNIDPTSPQREIRVTL